jgi:hypothetical protein
MKRRFAIKTLGQKHFVEETHHFEGRVILVGAVFVGKRDGCVDYIHARTGLLMVRA